MQVHEGSAMAESAARQLEARSAALLRGRQLSLIDLHALISLPYINHRSNKSIISILLQAKPTISFPQHDCSTYPVTLSSMIMLKTLETAFSIMQDGSAISGRLVS